MPKGSLGSNHSKLTQAGVVGWEPAPPYLRGAPAHHVWGCCGIAGHGARVGEPHEPHATVCPVGEEDEVSIREAAEAIVEAMDFTGGLVVSFCAARDPDRSMEASAPVGLVAPCLAQGGKERTRRA